MPRSRIDTTVRFETEIRMWTAAMKAGSARLECVTPGKAINLIARLNMCRAALRDELGSGIHMWDGFVTHRRDNVIIIQPKPRFDLSKLTDMYGNPIPVDDEAIIPRPPVPYQPMPANRQASRPARQTHEFDHTKPFGLDISDDKG